MDTILSSQFHSLVMPSGIEEGWGRQSLTKKRFVRLLFHPEIVYQYRNRILRSLCLFVQRHLSNGCVHNGAA